MKDPTIILSAASMALRSYEYGNASPDLARDTADSIERWLLAAELPEEVRGVVEQAGGVVDEGSVMHLPDGRGCFTASFPLPRDHWLYEPTGEPPAPMRVGTGAERDARAKQITAAARYAVKASTMNGLDDDFDPDALVQNMLVGMLGYWTHDGHSHIDEVLDDQIHRSTTGGHADPAE